MTAARRLGAAVVVVACISACSGAGGSGTGTTVASSARQQGALAAARACRMWSELMAQAVKLTAPITQSKAAPLDSRSGQVAAAANQASAADPAWSSLATDVAGATDFASAALPDINNRIVADCQKVPASVRTTVAKEPDPFATTTTAAP